LFQLRDLFPVDKMPTEKFHPLSSFAIYKDSFSKLSDLIILDEPYNLKAERNKHPCSRIGKAIQKLKIEIRILIRFSQLGHKIQPSMFTSTTWAESSSIVSWIPRVFLSWDPPLSVDRNKRAWHVFSWQIRFLTQWFMRVGCNVSSWVRALRAAIYFLVKKNNMHDISFYRYKSSNIFLYEFFF